MDDREISLRRSEEPPKYGSVQSPILVSGTREDGDYKVYLGRFYVLIVFALLTIVQSLAWLTFGTIPNESYEYFGLTDDDVTLLAGRSSVSSVTNITVYRRPTAPPIDLHKLKADSILHYKTPM